MKELSLCQKITYYRRKNQYKKGEKQEHYIVLKIITEKYNSYFRHIISIKENNNVIDSFYLSSYSNNILDCLEILLTQARTKFIFRKNLI